MCEYHKGLRARAAASPKPELCITCAEYFGNQAVRCLKCGLVKQMGHECKCEVKLGQGGQTAPGTPWWNRSERPNFTYLA